MSIFLLYGNEPFIIDSKLKEITERVFSGDQEMRDYNIDFLSSDDVYHKYVSAIETLPFMCSKRMVVFKRCELFKQKQNKKEEEISEYLVQYIKKNDLVDMVIIIVEGEKVDKRKRLYKAIASQGEIVEGKKLGNYELKKWITDKLNKSHKKFSPTLVEYLVNNLANDMYLIENEVNKLLSFVGDKDSIDKEDLHICSFTVTENIFKLIDRIIYKDLNAALTILHGMLKEGEPPMVILFMIIKQIRNIAMAKSVSSKGYTTKQIGEMIGVNNPYALSQLLKQSNQFTVNSIQKTMELVAEYEMKIKTGQIDYEKGLELLISNLNLI